MKKRLKSYLHFTRLEQMGIIALVFIILALITFRLLIPFFVHPPNEDNNEQRLRLAWEAFERAQPKPGLDTSSADKRDYIDADDDQEIPIPWIININSVDSATLVRLKGIGPKTASKIIAFRKEKGRFNNTNQLIEMHFLTKATFELLKNHLTTDTVGKEN